MIVLVMSTVSLADHSLHVCSRQVLLCARLAACHVPLVLNYNHGMSCDEAQWAYSGTPRRCIRQRRMANTIRSSCSMPWATRLYTVWKEGRSQLLSCLLHTYLYIHVHTHHTTPHIPSPHTHLEQVAGDDAQSLAMVNHSLQVGVSTQNHLEYIQEEPQGVLV